MLRLKSLSASVREEFRTHCDPASLITTEINGISTHMLEGQYVIKKYKGITKIYAWHSLLKPSSAQISE